VPKRKDLPVYFVEVQFRRSRRFYANLLAKVFSYLEANDPEQEWIAVALFSRRAIEPKWRKNYEDYLASPRVRRFYLDELKIPGGSPPGLALLQLASTVEKDLSHLVAQLLRKAWQEADCERANLIVELTEEVLIRRYHELEREEISSHVQAS
jgi:predicted transposase YdaD